jgi:uncharacterized Rmd1/YagE family protein
MKKMKRFKWILIIVIYFGMMVEVTYAIKSSMLLFTGFALDILVGEFIN